MQAMEGITASVFLPPCRLWRGLLPGPAAVRSARQQRILRLGLRAASSRTVDVLLRHDQHGRTDSGQQHSHVFVVGVAARAEQPVLHIFSGLLQQPGAIVLHAGRLLGP